ncbi:MAG: hypothetical protein U0183_05955 [Polyangiaceae bacterium]
MKLSALLRTLALTAPSLAFAKVAFAADEVESLGSFAEDGQLLRATLSPNGIFGTALSPIQGAIATGLCVFAVGCAVALLVARRVDRAREASEPEAFDADGSREVPALYSFQPGAVPPADVLAARAPLALPEAQAPVLAATPAPLRLLPPAPASAPTLPGASSVKLRAAQLATDDGSPEPTLVGWPPPAELPVDRSSQNDTRVVERSGVVPASTAATISVSERAQLLKDLPFEADIYAAGADPDATVQFVRGRTPETTRPTLVSAPRPRTLLPPAIRPIPISPPRAANVSELSFDDSPTEIGAPCFEEVQRELSRSSEIRAASAVNDPNATQAFLLVKSS